LLAAPKDGRMASPWRIVVPSGAWIGEQRGDCRVDEVDGRFIPRGDHEEQRVDQFPLREGRFAVLFVVSGNEGARHVIGRLGALDRDELGQHLVDVCRGGHGLLRRQGGVPDPVDGLLEAAPHVMRDADEVADDPDGELHGVGGAQVDDPFGGAVELVEQGGRVPLDRRRQGREPARGERRGDEPTQPPVRAPVSGEHVVHGNLEVQRPLPDDLRPR
jgi:hypothetical protein